MQQSGFKPEPFYSAELKFRDFQAGGERMKEKAEAEKLVAECCQAGSAIITKVEQKEKSEKPPALFDLTSLQREANRQLGFTAQQTLDYTQALYEKKLVTYPRTDSRYLTDDMAPLVLELVSVIQQSFQIQADVPAPVNAAQVINLRKSPITMPLSLQKQRWVMTFPRFPVENKRFLLCWRCG